MTVLRVQRLSDYDTNLNQNVNDMKRGDVAHRFIDDKPQSDAVRKPLEWWSMQNIVKKY